MTRLPIGARVWVGLGSDATPGVLKDYAPNARVRLDSSFGDTFMFVGVQHIRPRTDMTKNEVKAARQALGLSQAELAERLRMGINGERTVRRWEKGDIPITGPASVALELLLAEHDRLKASA